MSNLDPYQPYEVSARRQWLDRTLMRWVAHGQIGLAAHWLFLLNTAAGLFVLMAFLSPLLMAAGLESAGRFIFYAYSGVCHQYPERSFFVAGYQVAYCQRDVAIYTAVFVAGLAFTRVRHRLRPLPWWQYALMVVPMGLDGGTQLLGWRESTWELRVFTGTVFGVATVWWLYPYIERTMKDLRDESLATLRREGDAGHLLREGG